MQIAFKSDRGLNRAINQDYVSYFMNEAGQPLMIVCDGMGGHKAGDVASEMGVSHLGAAWK
ncbi:MAG TPA: protein-serine/threonine phosphatase, partial [Trichococcus flocculiformis]|nr:protein-serine/threonine phosphatase [Trichococcus flocculiformis]